MRELWARHSFIAWVVWFGTVAAAVAQSKSNPVQVACQDSVHHLLQAVASGASVAGEAECVPALIAIVQSGNQLDADLAIRALGAMKSDARVAVTALCVKLDSPRRETRVLAVDALVAIGEDSVIGLRSLLNAATARQRAAAVEALGRLKRLEPVELERLAGDSDPRVRAAIAKALTDAGRSGVSLLATYLRDPELSVAIEAARALQSNRANPSIAIPSLTEAVSRPHLGGAAGHALAAYGIEAKRAVPAIIAAYPLGKLRPYDWDDAAEHALEHIGPPDERDVAIVCKLLTHENAEIQILAAESLSVLGTRARAAASDLEAAATAATELALRMQSAASNSDAEGDPSGRVLVAAETHVAALWHVTHDANRFIELLQKLVVRSGPVRFSYPSPWREFTPDDMRLLEKLLHNSNADLQYTAIEAAGDIGAGAAPLSDSIIQLARTGSAAVSKQAIKSLGEIGPSAAESAAPVLMTRLQDRTIPLIEFANCVGELAIRSPDIQKILEDGLRDSDQWTSQACAMALCRTSMDSSRTAKLVISATNKGPLTYRNAINALGQLAPVADGGLPYLIKHSAKSSDIWTRRDAIRVLGKVGQSSAETVTALKAMLDDESILVRVTAAKAVYDISKDRSALEEVLPLAFSGEDYEDVAHAIEAISELGGAGAPFVHFLVAELHKPRFGLEPKLIRALASVGNTEAIAAIEMTAKSSDWVLHSIATESLRDVEKAKSTQGR